MLRRYLFLLIASSLVWGCDRPPEQVTARDDQWLIDSASRLDAQFNACKKSDLETAATYAEQELELTRNSTYVKGQADANANLGFVHYYRNNFPEALNYYLAALEKYELVRDTSGIAHSSYVIGKIHRQQGNYQKALEYSFRSLELQRLRNNVGETSSVLNGIGNIYAVMHEYDTAILYYSQRIPMERLRGDSAGVASAYADLGAAYTAKGDAERGLAYHLIALEKLKPVHIDSSTWYLQKFKAGVLIDVAHDYFQLHDFSGAIASAEESIRLATQVNARKEKRSAYKTLAELYGATGNDAKQLLFLEAYIALNDSLLSEEGLKQIADAEARYEVARKEKEVAVLNASNATLQLSLEQEESTRNIILLIGGSLLLLGGAGAFIIHTRNRLRSKQQEFRAMIDGEEKERKRIAMELHDGLGQLLSAARLNVSGLEENIVKEDDAVLKNSLSLIDDACSEVRNISHNLMPAALIRMGLVAALRELAAKVTHSGKLRVTFSHELYAGKLSDTEEITLYRIVQEIVNNAVKYAQASEIGITLSGERVIHVTVRDNGIGMKPGQEFSGNGIGWQNMRSRVELLNGKMQINAAPGQGTAVHITIPTNDVRA
jgi:two-component system, NarL family, sensor kinase